MGDIFVWLYELLLGIQDRPEIWEEIYKDTSIWLLIISFLTALIYYHIVNRFFVGWFKTKHWFIFMIINFIINFVFALIESKNVLEVVGLPSDVLWFALINGIYSVLFYIIFSLFVCWWSPYAKYTPFKKLFKKK